jgi:Ser/Thr protein kinase RdoA (MazF antagonist)
LSAFADGDAADLLPMSLGQRDAHVALVEFIHGTPLDRLEDDRLVTAAGEAGAALRRIHDCGVTLDRVWTVDNEIAQLRRTAGPATREGVENAIRRWTPPETGALVPSHRDFHPAQAVLAVEGIRFIDLDDAAMAMAGLDAGNFVAHLRRDAAVGARAASAVAEAVEAFLNGYGGIPDHLLCWVRISLARLAALAETRHGSLEVARRLLLVLEQPDAHLPERSGAGASNQPHGGLG